MKTVLITGSGGMVGSYASIYFLNEGWKVVGIDNNMRKYFFGEEGDVSSIIEELRKYKKYTHYNIDLGKCSLEEIFNIHKFDAIIHTAAQPSHDWAAKEPLTDFNINALATVQLLELVRNKCPDSPFIFTSTNKVYGDIPNNEEIEEYDRRYDFAPRPSLTIPQSLSKRESLYKKGINEKMPIDQCLHSVFGASKVAADIMCQEYGKYFDMPIAVFRGGCLTGRSHKSASLHGFLSYIVRCAVKQDNVYNIFGYKGKQVRDQIHAFDIMSAFKCYIDSPSKNGVVYNLGGGYENSASILEVIDNLKDRGFYLRWKYINEHRKGDHIVYYTDMSKFKKDYPQWKIQYKLDDIIDDLVEELV